MMKSWSSKPFAVSTGGFSTIDGFWMSEFAPFSIEKFFLGIHDFSCFWLFFQVSPPTWGRILEAKLSLNVCLTIGKWCKAIPWKNPANLSQSSRIVRRGRDWKKVCPTCPHIWTNCKMLLIETKLHLWLFQASTIFLSHLFIYYVPNI